MRSLLLGLTFLFVFPAAAHAAVVLPDLPAGVEPTELERRAAEAAFFDEEPFLDGRTLVARANADAYARMQAAVAAQPASAVGHAYLALAAERVGDFRAAAIAWKETFALAPGVAWPRWGLADFHARRVQPADELAVLVALEPVARTADALERLHQRAIAVIDTHALPGQAGERLRHRRAIVDLHPDDASYLGRFVDELDAAGERAAARAEIARWHKAHPEHARATTRLSAQLDLRDGKPDAAIARYRTLLAGAPLADDVDGRYQDFSELLARTGRRAEERARLEARVAAPGATVADVVPLFYLDVAEGDLTAARRRLADDGKRPPRGDAETLLYARLYARAGDLVAASRLYHALAASAATEAQREQALTELGALLLSYDLGRVGLTPLDPLDAFAADRFDTGPSLPGGVASLVFEHVREKGLGEGIGRVVTAWQNGERAGELLDEAWKRWPRSARVARLAAQLVGFQRAWKREDAAAKLADRFLAAWPDAREAPDVALAGAAARHALGERAASDKLYVRAIALAEKQGDGAAATEAYVRVLVGDKRGKEVVAVLWKRIERHPDDPAGYERLLAYVTQSQLADEELRVYERAIARFPGVSYGARLARWKLRHEGEAGYRAFLEGVIALAPGSEAEAYLGQLVTLDWNEQRAARLKFYEGFHKLALDRFPYRTGLVHRLLALYDRRQGGDPARAHALVVRYAGIDDGLRARVLDELARARRVDATLVSLTTPRGRVERLLRADLLVWASRQEEALPDVLSLRSVWPHDAGLARRAAQLALGLGDAPGDATSARAAVQQYDAIATFEPSSGEWPDAAGSALAEIGDRDGARAHWAKLVDARRGDPAAHLQVAAAAWDYEMYDDAARELAAARTLGKDPLLYWDRLGGVYESQRNLPAAAGEYVRGHVDEVGRELVAGEAPEYSNDDEDYGDYAPAAHGAETSATDRLAGLARRKNGKAAILAAFRSEAVAHPKDFLPVYALARWQAANGATDDARQTLVAAIDRFSDGGFLLRVARDAGTDHPLVLRALTRYVTTGKRAPDRLFVLADAYEAAGRQDDALAAYREATAALARRAPPSPAAADGYARLAAYHERRGRVDDALAALTQAAAFTPADARDERLFDLAWRHVRAGATGAHATAARAIFTDLRTRKPRDLRWLDGLGTLAVAARDDAALAALHKDAIAAIAKLPDLDGDERRLLVADARTRWIGKLAERGLHVDAIDQWIEVVNALPDERAHVDTAVAYGVRHGQIARFEAFYVKQAARSPQDVRWPIVLAWLHEDTGRPAQAAAAYAAAIAVRPDRIDLATGRARMLVAAADWPAAARAYAGLYDLSKEDPQYLLPEAHALLAAGKRADADRRIELWLTRAAYQGAPRFDAPAKLHESLGGWDAAARLRTRALDEVVAAPRTGRLSAEFLARLVEDGVRAGRGAATVTHMGAARQVLQAAAQLPRSADDAEEEDEDDEDDEDDGEYGAAPDPAARMVAYLDAALVDHLFDLIFTEAVDADVAVLLPACLKAADRAGGLARPRLLERAEALGLTDLTLDLVDDVLEATTLNDWQRARLELHSLELLQRRGGDRALVARFDARPALHTLDLLPVAADAARRLGDRVRERRYLAEAWDLLGRNPRDGHDFAAQAAFVPRYLELLVADKDDAAILAVVRRGEACGAQVIDWLFAHGKVDAALAGVDAAAAVQDRPERWRTATSGLAIGRLYPTDARGHRFLQAALGRGSIGARLDAVHKDARAAAQVAYAEKPWFALAATYARRLTIAPQKDVALREYALAAAEERPRSSAAQAQAGELFLAARDPARALRHFELALALEPSYEAFDGVARAELARGDRAAAFASWERIRAGGGDAAQVFYAEALARAHFVAEARAALAAHLATRWAKVEPGAGASLVGALAALYPQAERSGGGPLDRTLAGLAKGDTRTWPSQVVLDLDFSASYDWDDPDGLDYRAAGEADPLLADDALAPWYEAAIAAARARGDVAAQHHAERRLAAHLARTAAWARAEAYLTALRPTRTPAGGLPPAWIDLALADAALHLGRADAARAQLTARLQVSLDAGEAAAAADCLTAGGQPRAAAQLTVDFDARTAGLPVARVAAAHLVLERPDRAHAVVDAALARAPGDVALAGAAADVFAHARRPAEAVVYRQRALRLAPRDPHVRLALARDTAATGDRAAAIDVVVPIFGARDGNRAARAQAATLVGGWVGSDRALGAHAAAALARRAAATPFDSSTQLALARAEAAAGHTDAAVRALAVGRAAVLPNTELLVAEGERLATAGRAADAAAVLERAVVVSSGAPAARVALFRVRRAAGQHVAAVGALETSAGLADFRERREPATIDAGERDLTAALAPTAFLDFVAAAVDSAEKAGDPIAAAYFLSLAARHAPAPAATRFRERADGYLEREARRLELASRRFVSLREEF